MLRACSATCGRYPNLGASTSNNRKRWVQETAVCVSQSALQRGFGLFESSRKGLGEVPS